MKRVKKYDIIQTDKQTTHVKYTFNQQKWPYIQKIHVADWKSLDVKIKVKPPPKGARPANQVGPQEVSLYIAESD